MNVGVCSRARYEDNPIKDSEGTASTGLTILYRHHTETLPLSHGHDHLPSPSQRGRGRGRGRGGMTTCGRMDRD